MKKALKIALEGCVSKIKHDYELNSIEIMELSYILIKHRLAGYFYTKNQEEAKKLLPIELYKDLKYLTGAYNIAADKRLSEASLISKNFQDKKISHAFVKNTEYLLFGEEKTNRRANDIDLIFKLEDESQAAEVMKSFGYVQTYGELDKKNVFIPASKREQVIQKMYYHDLVPFCKKTNKIPTGFIEVDFNFKVESSSANLVDEFLDHTYIEDNISILDPLYSLSFLMIHYHREYSGKIWEESGRKFLLYKLLDVHKYMLRNKITFNEAKVFSKNHDIKSAFLTTFEHLAWMNQYMPESQRIEIDMDFDSTQLDLMVL